ncbi:hypothetical protein ACCT31_38420, partial [Rhizobium ruizarguesonis]
GYLLQDTPVEPFIEPFANQGGSDKPGRKEKQIAPLAKIVSSPACMVASPVVISLLAGGLWFSNWHSVGGGDMDPVKAKELDVVLGMISVD